MTEKVVIGAHRVEDNFQVGQTAVVQANSYNAKYPAILSGMSVSNGYKIIKIDRKMMTIYDGKGYRYFSLRKKYGQYREVGRRGRKAPYIVVFETVNLEKSV